jgi:uncharacterized protein (DUF427 family)
LNLKRIKPGPGQESVWDYPRPPQLEDTPKHIQVIFNDVIIADSHQAKRVLETSHPPVYYIPPEDIKMEYLTLTPRTTWCEWKGQAAYYIVSLGDKRAQDAAWYYPRPAPGFEPLKGHVAFYPSLMDACYVDGERVQAQAGDFYGGWITSDIVGPFKGGVGTTRW